MKHAAQYLTKHPYGATYSPWSAKSPHRGNDRPTPEGTPILIGSTIIGYTGGTGNNGKGYAPHLHTQAGTDPGVQRTINPNGHEFQPGTVTAVRSTDASEWGKFVTIRNTSGTYITYAHLSKVNVKVGDIIGGNMADIDGIRIVASEVEGFDFNRVHTGKMDKQLKDAWGAKPLDVYARHAFKVQKTRRHDLVTQINKLKAQVEELKENSCTNQEREFLDLLKAIT